MRDLQNSGYKSPGFHAPCQDINIKRNIHSVRIVGVGVDVGVVVAPLMLDHDFRIRRPEYDIRTNFKICMIINISSSLHN